LRYLFEDYALDTARRELRRGTDVVSVSPQVFDLLDYLIRNRERVVSKDDLIAAIWNGRIISETALTTRVYVARSVIGDSGEDQHLIKTLPRKGFRFVGEVREDHRRGNTRGAEILSESPRLPITLSDRPSIAVLTFVNKSGNPSWELFGEGIAEDVVTELSKLRWLIVIARNSSFACKQRADDVRTLGHELGVGYVVAGCVRQVEGSVRVMTQLIDAATGANLWVERYDRNSANIFADHDEIAEAIAAAIARTIVRSEQHRALQKRPENLGAWEAYQRGVWHMSKCDAAENELAQTFFQQAIDLDPCYAQGYGALAWSCMMAASIYSQMPVAEGCALSEPLVRKAIALDENDLEARARLALSALLNGDLEGAFQDAQQILAVNGNCADALGVKGAALVYSGRWKEGREAIRQYLKQSPSDPARPIRLGQIAASLYLDAGYEEAALTARKVIRQYPKHPIAYRWLAASLGQLGKAAEGQEVLRTLLAISPSSFDMYVRRQPPKYCSVEYAPMLEGLRKAGWKE
jgi:TolB-like protein